MTDDEKWARTQYHTQSNEKQICNLCNKQFKAGNIVYEDVYGNYYCTIDHFKKAYGLIKTKLEA